MLCQHSMRPSAGPQRSAIGSRPPPFPMHVSGSLTLPQSLVVLPCHQGRLQWYYHTHGWHMTDAGQLLTLGAEGTCLTSSFPWWKSQAPSLKPFNWHQTQVSAIGIMSETVLVIIINPNRKLLCYITRSTLRKIFSP